MSKFFRFPHTPHIAWLAAGSPREDKILGPDQVAHLLADEVVIEEKMDGANLGFSVGPDGSLRAQNRGQYLLPPFSGQFERLGQWIATHEEALLDALTESRMVFGEWCAARHSLSYDQLPDWWLMFDVYDRTSENFWSTRRRDQLAASLGVSVVPCLYRGNVSVAQLQNWAFGSHSRFGQGDAEGVIVRKEDAMWLQARAKLVRPNFTQAISQHWRTRVREWNFIDYKNDSAHIE